MDTSNMNTSVQKINSLGFTNIWSGSAYEAQSEQLTDTMSKLNQCIADVSAFDAILLLKEIYVAICNRISQLSAAMASCASGHTKEEEDNGCSTCAKYAAEIAQKEKERKELREEIIALLGQFSGIDAEIAPPADLTAEPVEPTSQEEFPEPKHNPFNSDLPITNEDYDGLMLTPEQGRKFNGPQAVETHYDLNMDYCVERMETEYGIPIEAWIDEETGLKMCRKVGEEKEYVMVAAYVHSVWYGNDTKPNAPYHMGDEVLTSWGEGLVVDYCEEAEDWYNAGKETRFDIATAWTPDPDICDHPSYYSKGSAYANAVNEEYKKNHPEEEQ